jgi:acetyl esterase/lipase
MPLRIDPQVDTKLKSLTDALGETEQAAVGDVEARRRSGHQMMDYIADTAEPVEGVETESFSIPTGDGTALDATWYRRSTQEQPGSAVLYVHGGGMIFSLEEMGKVYDLVARRYVAASGVPMLVFDYRVAPEHPHPTPVEDCYAALTWLAGQSGALGFDPGRLAVMGDSAGGGLAAGVCLLARDRSGPAVAQQLLIYPMLDDRPSTPDPAMKKHLTWTYDDNLTGWGALLGDMAGGDDVSPYAAPSRETDLTGLPDTYIDVGDLDIFRDEDISYASRLSDAGVPTELHLHPGCPHAFEVLAYGADVSSRTLSDRIRRLHTL